MRLQELIKLKELVERFDIQSVEKFTDSPAYQELRYIAAPACKEVGSENTYGKSRLGSFRKTVFPH